MALPLTPCPRRRGPGVAGREQIQRNDLTRQPTRVEPNNTLDPARTDTGMAQGATPVLAEGPVEASPSEPVKKSRIGANMIVKC